MKKFVKNNLKTILVAGATAIICVSGTAFAAYKCHAGEVGYKNGLNVEQALNELYGSKKLQDSKSGVLVLNNDSGEYEIECLFKPRYIMITQEKSDGTLPGNYILYWYNELFDEQKSFFYNKVNFNTIEFDMENDFSIVNKNVAHIYGVTSKGFKFCSPSNDGRKIYWSVFK